MACLRDSRVVVNKRSHRADNASINVFLDYARALTKDKKFKEAVSVYSMCAKMSAFPLETIQDLGNGLIDFYSEHIGKTTQHTDPWSCAFCATVLVDPVSLGACGHSVCKKCLLKDLGGVCRKCGMKYEPVDADPVDEEAHVKVTILVCELVAKYWDKELKAVSLRNDGNKLFQRGDVAASLAKYSEAFSLSPDDHLLTSNRSNAYFKAGRLEEALADADRTVGAKPDWGKGYFRRGMALAAMGQPEDALVAFFQCLVLEESCSRALRTEIYKMLFKLVNQRQSVEEEEAEASKSPVSKSFKFLSHPDLRLQDDGTASVSSVSTNNSSDSEEESEEKTITIRKLKTKRKMIISKNQRLCGVLDKVDSVLIKTLNQSCIQRNRDIDPAAVKAEDYDCSLCFRLLWQPVTTPCGHTYCRACIDRSLDHKPECPLCKTSLAVSQLARVAVNDFVESSTRRILPVEFAERQKVFEEEMSDLAGRPQQDGRVSIPVFVCTMSFPHIPCPLHVFEPRYRLMIRRAMETGTREFGMCTNSQDLPFSDYGTMLEIRDIQYFPDGRSVVDTMGGRRFKVLERDNKDGYNTATVEFLKDTPPDEAELQEVQALHDRTQSTAASWFNNHKEEMKTGILNHYGAMPAVEESYWSLPSGPAWAWWVLAILPLDTQAQQQILSQTNLKKRLEAIGRILGFIMRRNAEF